MNGATDHTPVLVGIGVATQREDDPPRAMEPLDLMLAAVRNAATDASPEPAKLLASVGRIGVPEGRWHYRNPGGEIARAIGAERAVSQETARALGVKHVEESATGRGSIAGYTVVYERGKSPRAVAIVDVGESRAVVQSEDPAIVARMESVDLCGACVQLGEDHSFVL